MGSSRLPVRAHFEARSRFDSLAIISMTVKPPRYPSLLAPPLQSSFAPSPRPQPFGSELDLLGSLPSSRLHPRASTHHEAFQSSLRSVLRFSQPRDGFLHARARGLISSRYHVQGPPVQGLLPSPSHPPSSGGACPLAVAHPPLTDQNRLPRIVTSASRL